MVILVIFGVAIILILIICQKYQKLKPFIKFSKQNNHCSGVVLRLVQAGVENWYQKILGPMFRDGFDSFWIGNVFVVILNNPDDVKIALNSDDCYEKPKPYEFFFKYGLLTEGGDKIRQQRKSLIPLFTPWNLKSYIPLINENFDIFIEKNSTQLLKFQECKINMKSIVMLFVFNTVLRTMLGYKNVSCDDDESMEFMNLIEDYEKTCGERIYKFYLHPDFIFKLSNGYQNKVKMRQKVLNLLKILTVKDNNSIDFDGISYFGCMKNHLLQMELDELFDSFLIFLGASFETTASSIISTLFLLASNLDKQQTLYDEVSSILSSHATEVTDEMMKKMVYLDLVIKESLRLIPISTSNARFTTNDVQFSELRIQ